jgi:hypothetical protein
MIGAAIAVLAVAATIAGYIPAAACRDRRSHDGTTVRVAM